MIAEWKTGVIAETFRLEGAEIFDSGPITQPRLQIAHGRCLYHFVYGGLSDYFANKYFPICTQAHSVLTVELILRCCVRLSPSSVDVCDVCIEAKRCVLEQKYQNEWPWPLFRGRIKVMSTTASHSPLNISETVQDRLGSKGSPIGNGLWGIKRSRDRWRHLTLRDQARDSNTLEAQYLENSWRCYLATAANY